jgi:hypothetical protein
MSIATVVNAHDHPEIVADTIDSIRAYMTKQVLVVVDGCGWDKFKDYPLLAAKTHGALHGHYRAPYRNLLIGMQEASRLFDADWYCYMDYDCLVGSREFLPILQGAEDQGVWCIGNDLWSGNIKFPILENMVGEIEESKCLLGCCIFVHRTLMDLMNEKDVFNKLLFKTMPFANGLMPGHTEFTCYDFGEYIFPTLAVHFGGRVAEFAHYRAHEGRWAGRYQNFRLRFRPELGYPPDKIEEATILHPVKDLDHPARVYHRTKRRSEQWKSSLTTSPRQLAS